MLFTSSNNAILPSLNKTFKFYYIDNTEICQYIYICQKELISHQGLSESERMGFASECLHLVVGRSSAAGGGKGGSD